MSRPPRRPRKRHSAPRQQTTSNSATALAMIALLVVSGVLVGIGAMVMPGVFALPAIGFGFVALIAFHYLIWGVWMKGLSADQSVTEDDIPTATPPITERPYADEFLGIDE